MVKSDSEAIAKLIKKGYSVVVANPFGIFFNQRYKVYQGLILGPVVVVDKQGKVVGLQG